MGENHDDTGQTGNTAITEEQRQETLSHLKSGELSQTEIASKVGISQSSVSVIKQSYSAGQSTGREEGRKQGREEGKVDAFAEKYSFTESDSTELDPDDEYWCDKCESAGNGRVRVAYLQPSCHNGHTLSWGN